MLGWLEPDWKGVDLWVAWGKGAGGQQGAMEPESPPSPRQLSD